MNKGVKELKAELKKYFPNNKFNVRYYESSGCSIVEVYVEPAFYYSSGESDDKKIDRVEAICKQYQSYKTSNPLTDEAEYASKDERPKQCATFVTFHNFSRKVIFH